MTTTQTWAERWERQQERYAVGREERFTVIADVVEYATLGQQHPSVVDLGCEPGSLSARLAARLPGARIVAADIDPFLLELGRATYANAARYVEVTIGEPGWLAELGLDGPLDAAVSTTAPHYPEPHTLRQIYRDLASVLRPGGALVNGDHLVPEEPAPAALTVAVGRRRSDRERADDAEDWDSWWAAVGQHAEFAEPLAARAEQPAPRAATEAASPPPSTNACSARRDSATSGRYGSTGAAACCSRCAERRAPARGLRVFRRFLLKSIIISL